MKTQEEFKICVDNSDVYCTTIPNGYFTKVVDSESEKLYYAILCFTPRIVYYVFDKLEVGQKVYFAHRGCGNMTMPAYYLSGKQSVKVHVKEQLGNEFLIKVKLDTGEYVIIDNGMIVKIQDKNIQISFFMKFIRKWIRNLFTKVKTKSELIFPPEVLIEFMDGSYEIHTNIYNQTVRRYKDGTVTINADILWCVDENGRWYKKEEDGYNMVISNYLYKKI